MANTADWSRLGAAESGRVVRVERLRRVARLLDSAIGIPGTRFRVGFDGLVGLIPGGGDALTALFALWIVYEARRLGLPGTKIARMLLNVGVDAAIGVVPVLGDLFDFAFKANLRNIAIIDRHFGEPPRR